MDNWVTGALRKILLPGSAKRLTRVALTATVGLFVSKKRPETTSLMLSRLIPDDRSTGRNRYVPQLTLLFALLLGGVSQVQAGEFCSSINGGVIDGNIPAVRAELATLTQITIDTDCTFLNFPASNPLTVTVNFQTNDPSIYLIVFDNVYFTGHMACSNIDHKLWFVNGADYASSKSCQDLFIPVESIGKQSPAGTASVGEPFTYTLNIPVMYDPATDTYYNNPSPNTIGNIKICDDLSALQGPDYFDPAFKATGADVTYVSHTASLVSGGLTTPITLNHSPADAFCPSADGNKTLYFSNTNNPVLSNLTAGDQIELNVTVVLDNTPGNTIGKTFINTAEWWFSRSIDVNEDGIIQANEFFDPLPGQSGVSEIMSIAEPDLIVTKSADTSTLSLGVKANYTIDVQNNGGGDAWYATIADRLPTGMCDYNPTTGPITAQLFAADGSTAISGPLTSGTDYTAEYLSGFGVCGLRFRMVTPQAVIGPSQILRITYQSQIDTPPSPSPADGSVMTNVAGATLWYSGDGSYPRNTYTRTLSDGTPGVNDYQDNWDATVTLSGYYFQKTVTNRTTGAYPATSAFAGDRLRYTLRLINLNQTVDNIIISDVLDPTLFNLGTYSEISRPAGSAVNFNGASGAITVTNFSLAPSINPPAEAVFEFEINLAPVLADGTPVSNQSRLTANGGIDVLSDDPYVSGVYNYSNPPAGTTPDPTDLMIYAPGRLDKSRTQATATIGEQFTYRITIPNTPVDVPLYDVRILDNLGASAADMRFVGASVVSGGSWTLSNSGTATNLLIEDTATGIDIPANGKAVIDITVEVDNTAVNQSGLSFNNVASYTYNRVNGSVASQTAGAQNAANMSLVEPLISGISKSFGFISPASKTIAEAATAGDVLEFVVTAPSTGNSTAFDINIIDALPADLTLVPGSATAQINGVAVAGFAADPTVLPGGVLNWGKDNGDESLDVPAGQSLVLRYQATVTSVSAASVSNSVYLDWTSVDAGSAAERNGAGCPTITAPNDYCVGPATVTVNTVDNNRLYKRVVSDSYAESPTSTGLPVVRIGDTVTYRLQLDLQENTTRNVVVEDILPVGMALQSFNFFASAGADFSYVPVTQPAVGDSGTLRWELGDIVNTPSNDGTPVDQLYIRYVAKVVPNYPPVGVGHTNTTQLDNQASLSYTGGDPLLEPTRLTDSTSVEVRRPRMQAISKVELGGGRTGTGTVADPYQVDIASDVMSFQLSSCNTGPAPAYDVVITDLLAPELDETDLATTPPVVRLDATTLTVGVDYLYTAPARGGEMRFTLQDSAPVPPGSCLTVDYSMGFYADLTAQSTWSNQARLREYWTLPTNGRRYVPSTPAEIWMTNVINVEPLTKSLLSPASGEATIGQLVQYQVTVPGAPMNVALNNVVMSDTLHGALQYLNASAVDGSGNPVALTDNSVAPGSVSLAIANIPAGKQAIITLRTRVRNTTGANAGTSFSNSASYSYSGMPVGSNTTGSSGPLRIVEPLVSVSSAVSSSVPRAGDTLTYTLDFTASGGGIGDNFSPAYDLTIEDSLSLGLLYEPGSATVNGVPLVDPVTTGNGVSTPQSLTWSLSNGTNIDIPEGTSTLVSYRVSVLSGVGPGDVLTNSVIGRWTSLNGNFAAIERTGSGTPALNDYFTAPSLVTLTIGDNSGLAKSVIDDSYNEIPASTGEPIVRIGDTVTYQLRLELQEGTTQNVVIEDILPPGVALESFAINATPNFSYALGVQPAAGDSGTLRWELGDVVNTPSNDGTPVDSMYIRYVARTLTAPPPVGVGDSITSLLDNQASLNYTGAVSPQSVTSTVNVRRPFMDAVSKTETVGGRVGSGTAADPYQIDIVSDTMSFQLNSCNSGQAPAYRVVIVDQLASQLDEGDLAANPPTVRVDGTTLIAGVDYLYSAPVRGGQMRIELRDSVPLVVGSCVTVDYSLGFYPDIAAQSLWSNQAIVEEYWTLPLNGRRYDNTTAGEVWMTNLVTVEPLLKSMTAPASGEATVGQVVEYRLTVPGSPMNMALDNVVVSDTLHGSLLYQSATAVDGAGNPVALTDNSTLPGSVSLNIATVPAGEQVIITLRARVDNNAQANAGTSFSNIASYSYNGMPAGTVTSGSSTALTVIEPLLTLTKGVDDITPRVGGVLTYSLTVTASGAGAGDDFSAAYDLTVEDSLGIGLLYEPGSATLDGVSLADPVTNSGDGITSAQSLSWNPTAGTDIDLAEGQSAVITYQARVLNGVSPGQSISNSALVRWTGRNGNLATERTGTGTPAVNDYFTAPAVVTVTAQVAVSLTKSVINLSTGENPGANAEPGQTLSYTLVLGNDSVIAVNNVSLIDELGVEFEPGTLQLITVPAGVDSSATDPIGGVNGSGIVDIRNISLAPQGDPAGNDSITVSFSATLAQVLSSGSSVLNQAIADSAALQPTPSNPVSTLITSAPSFDINKTSEDLTRDPAILLPNETLRYTITVRNTGNENTVGVTLRDVIPDNTTYMADSTTLNGLPVADPTAGVSALESGMLINAPADPTPGLMLADPTSSRVDTVATITFDVVTDSGVLGGTYISNQAFVSGAGEGGAAFSNLPSDNPVTLSINDPTRDIIGNLPLLDETKLVDIVVDNGTPGVADPGDVLRYSITVSNFGTVAATGVVLTDAVPANTSYVANSTTLDGAPLGQLDGGVSPLAAGVMINAAGNAAGTFDAEASAVVTFNVQINAGVVAGTVITNQGFVASNELATEPTDVDGDDSNGDQPTVIVVGSAQQLAIVKSVNIVGGGAALPGGELEYEVLVLNTGDNPANSVLLTDDLNPLAGQASYVPGSGYLSGSAVGITSGLGTSAVTYVGGVLSVDYAAVVGDLGPGEWVSLRFRVAIDSSLPAGTTITNTAQVQWNNTPVFSLDASVTIDVGGVPGTASITGQAWHDANFDNIFDTTETPLASWQVEVYLNGNFLGTLTTDSNGTYSASGLAVTAATDQYELRFVAPNATATTASLGYADSAYTNGPQRISGVTGPWGSLVQGLNLPIDPNGVVFDSIVRDPVSGATLTMQRNGVALPASCFDDPAQQGQVTLASGFYKFDLNFSDSACPAGGDYVINVIPPVGNDFEDGPSRIIPPVSNDPAYDATATPYDAINCNADAVAVPAGYCEAMPSELAPVVSVTASSVRHYLYVTLSTPTPEESQLFNNHIPLDPVLDNALTISKRSPMVNVTRSQLVPYTITINNTMPVALQDLSIVDTFPPGFKYVSGSASLNGVALDPVLANGTLSWSNLTLEPGVVYILKMLLIVGSGVSEGEYVNQVQMYQSVINGIASGVASATVRVVPDPTFDCSDIIGKVFDDKNLNGYQDEGEKGLAGTRVVSARGLIVTSDEHGRFHLTCAMVPNESRGSNYVLKLDDRSLPSGYRVTTENPRVQRLTRGKVTKFNFGATIHRVVRLDVADGVFEPGTTEMRQQWKSRLESLSVELQKAPSVLRISYLADVEDEGLVGDRVAMLKELIGNEWESLDCCYKLTIETEIFWRRGAPPERSGVID